MLCTYSTPCGWCAKWDKKCDKKIGCKSSEDADQIITHIKETISNKPCKTESDHKWECCGINTLGTSYICAKCHTMKFEKDPAYGMNLIKGGE